MPFDVLILGIQMASTVAEKGKHGEFKSFVDCDQLILMAMDSLTEQNNKLNVKNSQILLTIFVLL